MSQFSHYLNLSGKSVIRVLLIQKLMKMRLPLFRVLRQLSVFSYHEFQADRALPVHLDGEPFAEAPVITHTVPSALTVIVPKNVPGNLFSW